MNKKGINNLQDFLPTNINNPTDDKKSDMIPIDLLIPYADHPFKLYEEERFSDMVRSIKEMGILLPIIIRPAAELNKYEILSGHNRVNAAKEAGLLEVPAIVKSNLTNDEAKLIVTETNLVQRSFTDLLHSERAVAVKHHMDAIKSQGKRNNLIDEIYKLSTHDKIEENDSLRLLGAKPQRSDKLVGKEHGLAARNVHRYIRLTYLSKALLDKVDRENIGLYPAVSISYLSADEQSELNQLLDDNDYKIDMKKADSLRVASENKKLNKKIMEQILSGTLNKKAKTKLPTSFTIKRKLYLKYFENIKQTEVESIIDTALGEYFEKRKNK